MKSIVTSVLALGILAAVIFCSPVPTENSGEVVCNKDGCRFPVKDYGPSVTPYTPTLKPRVRTMIVPPLWVNQTWMEIIARSSSTMAPEEDQSAATSVEDNYDENEEDNMV
ncbi:AAEL006662-PA [Aedes aegypti]|uniref:AAEL006662-PA n=2 Tax=Aedes aegypti TaxID=7159 RepID=A0A6E8PJ39_AEDAE|nr:AAEL006662-PA [Aedes aegypti]